LENPKGLSKTRVRFPPAPKQQSEIKGGIMNHTTDKAYKSLAISIVSLAVSDIEGYSRYIEKRKGEKFKIFTQIKNCSCIEDYFEEHKKLMRYLATHSTMARKGLIVAIKKAKNCFTAVNFLTSKMCGEICEIYHEANDILVKCKRKYNVI
jgi:hypothetical protein